MSWWVYLQDHTAEPTCSYGTPPEKYKKKYPSDEPCPEPCYPAVIVEPFEDGGTYVVGGTCEAELNVTYNYGGEFRRAWADDPNPSGSGVLVRMLDGKRAGDVIEILEHGAEVLGTDRALDYWEPTPGNAGAVLARLASWARQHPDAVFKVS
jgi:hypothetical protein